MRIWIIPSFSILMTLPFKTTCVDKWARLGLPHLISRLNSKATSLVANSLQSDSQTAGNVQKGTDLSRWCCYIPFHAVAIGRTLSSPTIPISATTYNHNNTSNHNHNNTLWFSRFWLFRKSQNLRLRACWCASRRTWSRSRGANSAPGVARLRSLMTFWGSWRKFLGFYVPSPCCSFQLWIRVRSADITGPNS